MDHWFNQVHLLHSPTAARQLKLRTSIQRLQQRQSDSSKKRYTPKRIFNPSDPPARASPSPVRGGASLVAKKLTFPSPTPALHGSGRKRKTSSGTVLVVGSGPFSEARQKKLNMSSSSEETTTDVVELARKESVGRLGRAACDENNPNSAKRLLFQLSPTGPTLISMHVAKKATLAEPAPVDEIDESPSSLVEKLTISSAGRKRVAPSSTLSSQVMALQALCGAAC
jgi:hypothetical protein